jgi:streptogramin lyase
MFVPPPIHQRLAGFRLVPFGRRRRHARHRSAGRPRARFRLEGLEDRCLLSITEFPAGGGASYGIVAGPDGNLWFTEATAQIGEMSPTSYTVSEFPTPTPDSEPNEITAGPDGNLWFTEYNVDRIGTINPTTHATSDFAVPSANGFPAGITAGPDGNVWFTETGASKIGMINPTTDAISEFSTPTGGSFPLGITAGQDGNLWFTERDASKIGEIDPTTDAISEFPTPTADSDPIAITTGPDGNLWFTEGNADRIGEINPTTHAIAEFSVPTANGGPDGITAGPDGNLWFTEYVAGQIGVLNPTTDSITEYPVPYTNSTPVGITTGPDGNIWFTDPGTGAIGVDTLNTTHVVVTEQPAASVTAGTLFGLTVQADDGSGNLDSSFDGSVTVALENNPGEATLGGTLTATASGGVATFSDLTLTTAASGYTLAVSSSGVSSATTNAITVTPAAATQLVIQSQPPATATAGAPLTTEPVIDEEDQFGNIETGDDSTVITASLSTGSAQLVGALATVNAGVATFTNLADDTAGTVALDFSGGGFAAGPSNSFTIAPAAASQLVIQTQPSATATAGQPLTTQPVIYEEDQFGNLETGDNSTVITAAPSAGPAELADATATVSAGVATFTTLAVNSAGTIALDFTGGGVASGPSNVIAVSPAAASKLVIDTQPSAIATAGASFATQPVIDEEDQYGNLETGDNSTVVTVSLASGSGPLQGTTTATVTGGVAKFTNLADDVAGSITLGLSGGGFVAGPSESVTVNPAAAAALVIETQPSQTASAGVPFAIEPVIHEEDQYGNLETTDSTTVVTASLASGAVPLAGTTSVTLNAGVARFNSLAADAVGTITLAFTGGGFTTPASLPIVVGPGPAAKLVIQTQPSGTATAGQAFAVQPVIDVEDQFGDLGTADDSTVVTATLNSGAGLLLGTTSVTTTSGIATFVGLGDDTAGTIVLKLSSAGLASAVSDAVAISPAGASQFVISTQPSAKATAGQPLATEPVVDEEDRFGNLETGDDSTVITASPSAGSAQLVGTTAIVTGGVANFTELADDTAGTIALDFSGGGLAAGPSSSVMVAPAAASELVIHTEPSPTATAGQPLATEPVVYEEDQFGNLETGDNHTVITAAASSGPAQLVGASATVAGGVATFVEFADDTAGTIALDFSGGGMAAGPSSSLVVAPAAASKLVIHTQPAATATAGQLLATQPVIYEEDQFGNLETGDNSTVVTASASAGSAQLVGATATVTGGMATFTELADDTAGTTALDFSGGGLAAGPSNSLTVSAAAASKLVVETQPSPTATAGTPLAGQPVVYEEDQYGNLETGDNSTVVTASLATGAGPLQGTRSIELQSGVAAFSNLSDNLAETIALEFSGGGLSSGPSNSVVVGPAARYRLVIRTEPSTTATAGQSLATRPVVLEEDQYGNLETTDSSTVVTAIPGGGSAQLSGGTSVSLASGIATFTDLAVDTAGSIALAFSGAGLTSPASVPVVVSPGPANELVIQTQPSPAATAGRAFAVAPVIDAEDQYGNLVTANNGTEITASLSSGTGPLFGTATVATRGGVATFTGLSDDTAQTVVLKFSADGLASALSAPVAVGPAASAQLVIHSQPTSTVVAGTVFTASPVLYEEDQYGNLETTDNSTVVTLSQASGPGTLEGTTSVTVQAGVATFTDLLGDTAGTLKLEFTAGNLTASSNPITVTAGRAVQLVVTSEQPSSLAPGQPFSVVVAAEDQFHNVDTTFSGGVSILLANDPRLTTVVQAQNGIATFSGLTATAASSGDAILASTTGLPSTTTSPLNVTAGPPPPPPPPPSTPPAPPTPTPTIVLEHVTDTQKLNKKAKPSGKPVFTGFSLQYSTAMNAATAGLASNYQVVAETVRKVKRKNVIGYKPVNFTVSYTPTTDSVSINLSSPKPFTKGGRIVISGVTTQAGVSLDSSDTMLSILPKAKRITLE